MTDTNSNQTEPRRPTLAPPAPPGLDKSMSVFVPRVFGQTREAIEELIKLRFDQEGLGIVDRVDFVARDGGATLSAFVHFLQWNDTPAVVAMQRHMRACSDRKGDTTRGTCGPPARMDAHTIVEDIPLGQPGAYWLLLENTSKACRVPPVPECEEDAEQERDEEIAISDLMERLILQSKRIRDLEQEKKRDAGLWTPVLKGLELSERAFPPGTDLREKAGDEAIKRQRRTALLEEGADMDVQCEAQRAATALAEVTRLKRRMALLEQGAAKERSATATALAEVTRLKRELVAKKAVAETAVCLASSLKERNQSLVEEGDKAIAQWREVVGRLRGRPSQGVFERMRSDLAETRGKLMAQIAETAQVRQELDRSKPGASQAPPPAPLKRSRTAPPPQTDSLDELREAWQREGMEGPVGDAHDADMEAMSQRSVRFAQAILVDARGPTVAVLGAAREVAQQQQQ